MSSISDPVDTYVGGGAWRGSCIRSTGFGAVGQQQVSVTLDVQERVCCMQCVVRSVDVQPAVAKASTMMSVMLETCVTRPLMDMTMEGRARVVPAMTSRENRDKVGRRRCSSADFFASCRISRVGNEPQRRRGVRYVVRTVRSAVSGEPDGSHRSVVFEIASGVRLEIEEMHDGAQRLGRRSVHERL